MREWAPKSTKVVRKPLLDNPPIDLPTVKLPLSESVQKSDRIISSIDATLESAGEKFFSSSGVVVDFSKQQQEKRGTEYFLSKEWLQEEVAKERHKPQWPGETPWYHLDGTGFWVKEQVGQLLRNVSGVGREIFPHVLDHELAKVKVDVEAFEDEYLKQMASLRWNLSWGGEGQKDLVCTDYGNVSLRSVTGKQEREGAVYETLFGDKTKGTTGVEGWLKTAPTDSFAIIFSPAGWSNLATSKGEPIVHKETQIYGMKKRFDGSLETYTLRYDATLEQNEQLQEALGLSISPAPNHKERIKNMMRNVTYITPETNAQAVKEGRKPIRNFENLLDLMQEKVGGREVAYGEGGDLKTFADMKAFLKHPERFSQRHPLTDSLINRFQEYTRWRFSQGGFLSDIETDLQIGLAASILQLNRLYRDEEQQKVSSKTGKIVLVDAMQRLWKRIQRPGGMNYGKEKEDLQDRPGCAGGGQENKVSIFSMGGSRSGEASSGREGFSCPKCPFKAAAGEAIGNQCPGCGLTKEAYAEETGVSCD